MEELEKMKNITLTNNNKSNKFINLMKIISYTFIIFGLLCLLSQLLETGIYQYGEDATLFIVGLIMINIGLTFN